MDAVSFATGGNASAGLASHPFFPLDVAISRYAPNSISGPVLVGYFALGVCFIFLTTLLLVQRSRSNLTTGETWATLWFAVCGCIHTFFEGYFALNFLDMASQMDLFGQLWKEYSLSDSRYMTQDSFVVCMETITAVFWGPLSFLCAYYIVTDHPMRHPLTIIISLGQIYGLILYYATCSFSSVVFQVVYCRPEDFYFWMYYVLCNAFWIFFPGALMWSSIVECKRAFEHLQATTKNKKTL
ncbi:hypothetical protein AK830_g6262 [Neonectria ditissima]|uniref:EXPERA domain-containing protein n=1 Tax=Neonectria ditissima TaxID=78410 RepID=A0A0P7BH01_9HYPO|nr:hypothetical protein AK830_g6262 [Neonectria ditissima]